MSVRAETIPVGRPRPGLAVRALQAIREHMLAVFAVAVLVYLLLPIAVVALFSFNDPAGRYNYTWSGFTLDHWLNPFAVPGLQDAIVVSLEIALLASLLATILGTPIALALARYRYRGRGATNTLVFMAMTAPEIVLGASLLTLFLNLGTALGFWTIVLAHIMFCISFVVVTVRARLVGFDRHVEEAAADLGANEWVTFLRITLPLIAPGILAGALLAFSLSIDDFVITSFNSGTTTTFPLYVWSAAQRGVPAEVNVIGTMIFGVAIVLMLANVLWQYRREPKGAE
jgi:spermidine/putrescine transport system permease protein